MGPASLHQELENSGSLYFFPFGNGETCFMCENLRESFTVLREYCKLADPLLSFLLPLFVCIKEERSDN